MTSLGEMLNETNLTGNLQMATGNRFHQTTPYVAFSPSR